MRRWKPSVIAVCLLAFGCMPLVAASLKVSPARFMVQDIVPGMRHDIHREAKARLTVYNDSNTTRSYNLSVLRPVDGTRWEKGYTPIPDPKWCWFDPSEVTIGPNGQGFGHVFVHVPSGDSHCNQHWIAILETKEKPRTGAGGVGVAVHVRAQIETISNANSESAPHGDFAVSPGLIDFGTVVADRDAEKSAHIYNNTSERRSFKVISWFQQRDGKAKFYLTGGFESAVDASWFQPDTTKFSIGPNETKLLRIRNRVPGDASLRGRRFEQVLMVIPDKGLSVFIRARCEVAK